VKEIILYEDCTVKIISQNKWWFAGKDAVYTIDDDPTENTRRAMVAAINAEATPSEINDRDRLEDEHGKGNVWDTDELAAAFEVVGFIAPFVMVRRLSDGVKGTVMFQHSPRIYFAFKKK
jgi:hypothetical protein